MTALDIINNTVSSQPEGRELLNIIKIDMVGVHTQYDNCDLLRSIVKVKFDVDKLHSSGYSLQEILDICPANGVMAEETHKFILTKIQAFLRAREKQEPEQNNS